MEEKNIIDFLFERREENTPLRTLDKELQIYSQITKDTENELQEFIRKRVHPKSQEKLKKLIEENQIANYDYFYKENQLFYKCGFLDAMNVVISIFSFDKDCSI